jgi:hypothetical protein
MKLSDRFIARVQRRQPDFVIGATSDPYLLRWWTIPRNVVFNVYAHCFMRSDDDRAHHDHPWLFNMSIILRGECTEHTITAGGALVRTVLRAGDWKFRWGKAPHRIELHDGPCWTLFITGPRVREWGFYCMERGWIHWKRFTAADDPGTIGSGCDA